MYEYVLDILNLLEYTQISVMCEIAAGFEHMTWTGQESRPRRRFVSSRTKMMMCLGRGRTW